MIPEDIEREFKTTVGEQVRLVPEGEGRFRVFTPFVLDDGDHLGIVLKQMGGRWLLTDEGHTFMQVGDDKDETDLRQDTSHKVISDTSSALRIEDRDGELILPVPDDRYGDALHAFVLALLAVANIRSRAK